MNNISAFIDTQIKILTDKELKQKTKTAIKNSRIYKENFRSSKSPFFENSRIYTEENGTLDCAERFKDCKTAVLNFANGIFAGGSVLLGANAQEEYLCRQSNLYNCIANIRMFPFYLYNTVCIVFPHDILSFPSTDRLIYSNDVTVIKKNNEPCIPYNVDVITCAAPLFYIKPSQKKYDKVRDIFKSRILNIAESVIENDAEILVLGAFGCGEFNNPPEIVAKTFKEVFDMPRYKNAFREVIFAIKGGGKNLAVFSNII